MDPTLNVKEGTYPFGQSLVPARVQEVQTFSSPQQLKDKKREVLKKRQMVTHPSVIRIETVKQTEDKLIYLYEWVPHSLESYLRGKRLDQCESVWQMTKNLLLKKVQFEMTVIISYLAKMKIETDLSPQNFGLSSQEKLKLYISPRSKMGTKSEIQLLLSYNNRKEALMRYLQALYAQIDDPTFSPPSSEPLLPPPKEHSPSRLRHTRTFQESNEYRQRKMSQGHFDLGASDIPLRDKKRAKDYKYSFQSEIPKTFNPKRDRDRRSFGNYEPDVGPQSKTIKIELEQTQNKDDPRKRKDSYKLKITTFREYEMEGNPADMFGAGNVNSDADIFQYFAKRAKKEEEDIDLDQPEEGVSDLNEGMEEEEIYQRDRFRKETGETLFSNMECSSPKSPYSLPDSKKNRKSSKNLDLEERIRQAKVRTTKALDRIKALKK